VPIKKHLLTTLIPAFFWGPEPRYSAKRAFYAVVIYGRHRKASEGSRGGAGVLTGVLPSTRVAVMSCTRNRKHDLSVLPHLSCRDTESSRAVT
jgi:hypothetical protein